MRKIEMEIWFWFCITIMVFGILSLFAMMIIGSWGNWFILFPVLLLVVLRDVLWTYIKGIIKLDSSNFPSLRIFK